ncbi:MAG: rhomboid family intramembrane serine protease [Bdellovibrionota bacterium]
MKSRYKCPHCEIRLNALAGKFYCGVCKSEFVASELTPDPNFVDTDSADFAREYLKLQKQLNEEKRGNLSIVHTKELPHVSSWKLALSFLGVPIEEDDVSDGFPFVLGAFAALCILVFFFVSKEKTLLLSLDPKSLWRMGGLNFFTYSVVHADIFHLIGNLFFIIPFLDNTEHRLGERRTLAFVLVAALASAVLHLMFDKSTLPLVGASGVCFAIVVFYSIKFPNNRLLIMPPFLGFLAMRYRMRIKARTLAIFYVLKELFGVVTQLGGLDSVSHLGHVGGALTGVFFALWVDDSVDS